MSNLYLYHFNGSIARDKYQEAIIKDMNQKDEFLKKVREEREERQLFSKKNAAAVKIQSTYRSYRCRANLFSSLRESFDLAGKVNTVEALHTQISRLAFFFNQKIDLKRTMSLCADAVSLSDQKERIDSYRCKQLLRCAVLILPYVDRSTPYVAALRCIEIYCTERNYEDIVQRCSFFKSIISLFANQFDLPDPLQIVDWLPPRADAVLRFLLLPLQFGRLEDLFDLIYSLCSSSSDLHVVCYVTPFIGRFVKRNEISLSNVLRCLDGKLFQLEELNTTVAALFVHNLVFISSFASIEQLSIEDRNVIVNVLAVTLSRISRDEEIPQCSRADSDSEDESYDVKPSPKLESSKFGTLNFYADGVSQMLASDSIRNLFIESAVNSEEQCAAVAVVADFLRCSAPTSFLSLFNVLGANRLFIGRLWSYILSMSSASLFSAGRPLITLLERGEHISEPEERRLVPSLSLFVALLSGVLFTVDDDDFVNGGRNSPLPFEIGEIADIARHFRDLTLGLIDIAFPVLPLSFQNIPQKIANIQLKSSKWSNLFKSVASLTKVLHERDSRLHFMPAGFWSDHNRQVVLNTAIWKTGQGRRLARRRPFEFVRLLLTEGEEGEEDPPSSVELRNISILRAMPFVIPFLQRVEMFSELIHQGKQQSGRDPFRRDVHNLIVHRSTIYEDGFSGLSPAKAPDLRNHIRVQMVNWAGLDEAGIDGGGIFREFLSELLQTAFDPARGFFTTTHEQLLYPNPLAPLLYPNNFHDHFYFIGRICAKLIYEGLLAELRFADFFLVQWLGASGDSLLDLEYVKSYDPMVHANLNYLKRCAPTEVESLDLDFSVLVDKLGVTEKIELKKGGMDIRVTAENRAEYIRLYVNFYLSKRLAPMINALRAGVRNVLEPEWLRMFSSSEINILIGGVDAEIDFDDLKKFTTVHNIQSENDKQYVEVFWLLANELSRSNKKRLLKFITGCSRPPLMGFKALNPAMGIQLVHESSKLPTAATCMNLLKLPVYSDVDSLRNKMLFAINSGAGFELS